MHHLLLQLPALDPTWMPFLRLPPKRLAPESPPTLNLFQSLLPLPEVPVSKPMLAALSPPPLSVEPEFLHMPIPLEEELPLSRTPSRLSADLPLLPLEVMLLSPWEVSLDTSISPLKPMPKWFPS